MPTKNTSDTTYSIVSPHNNNLNTTYYTWRPICRDAMNRRIFH